MVSVQFQSPKILFCTEALGLINFTGPDCPYIPTTIEREMDKSTILNVPYRSNFHALDLDENHVACYNSENSLVVLNNSAFALTSFFDQPNYLGNVSCILAERWGNKVIQSTLEKMIELGLLVQENYIRSVPVEMPITLSAWLHITDRCNLRCAYCYLPHHRVDMSFETGCAAIEATFRSARVHKYGRVQFKYAGGEAMLRFPLIAKLHQRAQSLAEQNGFAVDGVILSNGTLLSPSIVKAMQSLGLRLMISLDGLGEYQDRQRYYPDGNGTSTHVTHAVNIALEHGLVPHISVTVTNRNASGLPELMAWILKHDLPFSLNFYRENDLSTPYADLKLDEETIISGMLAAYKIIESKLPRRSLLASLVDRANLFGAHSNTCGVGHSYLVFDHQGNVSKCQMHIGQAISAVHADDPLSLIRGDRAGIQNISVDDKEGCRSCEWKYWCAGGCPLVTYRATGRYDVKSPNCNLYKRLYPEAIRLEGLRLLKYADELGIT